MLLWCTQLRKDLFCYTHSKNAVFDNKKAVRGGIPVVFRKSPPCRLGFHYDMLEHR